MKNRYDPVIRHLHSLREECQQKGAPEYVVNGIDTTLNLIAVCYITTQKQASSLLIKRYDVESTLSYDIAITQ